MVAFHLFMDVCMDIENTSIEFFSFLSCLSNVFDDLFDRVDLLMDSVLMFPLRVELQLLL